MELVKNIFFNTDKLTPNTVIKISYIGKLFQNNSEKVFIHYGFDNEWKNSGDIEMNKTELGFQAEIQLIDSETFNFCFKNDKDDWDNNNNQNYVFEVEHPQLSLVLVDNEDNLSVARKLRKSYIWKKKIKISIYKILTYLPKLITGNYKRKSKSNI